MSLVVEQAGALASIQDRGRFGVRHLGVTQGGAVDWLSCAWANWLLGNPLDAPVVEVTLGNFRLRAETDARLAIFGADLGATLDGQPIAPGHAFTISRGQQLTFSQPRHGARAYLAAPGGFQAPRVLGSCATVRREQMGGLADDGRALRAGDRLCWQGHAAVSRELPAQAITALSGGVLSVVPGAQIAAFSGTSLFAAFNGEWVVDQRADRMGVRLLGPTLHCRDTSMVSEGIPLGAIQVPADGQPIILLNDRQTIGGYPRLGALTPLAVAQLAQCLPGSVIRLRPVSLEAAQREQRALLNQWR
ncbi:MULTISPECIES: 5-oxoprolinase subunit C family protein [Stutzerimonas]|uniref:5-oxoprolinase subunit C family protein n=1 Tax=Stutzerimonas TaxID=2901164 RepID=UPI0012E21376|nr:MULTISPECIES: biotin-dependent carboxyltransferase family protein [Stutzerimonas]MUT69044.1 5-oxoprolinase/urea amidolyase family protein [Stutzerimonas frequens]WAE60627.1 biotin-dependent carboxyltransferase family protein [Stutzerimonas sp. R40042]